MSFTVIPLNLGTLVRDKSGFTYLRDPGTKLSVPVIAYLVKDQGKLMLVDTGPDDPRETAAYHQPFFRTQAQQLLPVLTELNVKPQDIAIVILTHLHWDHCYNTELFPNAEIIVQDIELSYAKNPLPIHRQAYDTAPIKDKKFTTINGDTRISNGVTALVTPGHSPGSQSVLLENGNRKILIASDTIPFYENWNSPSPIPNGAHYNLADYYATFDKMKKLSVDYVLPGHDQAVFEKAAYSV